MLVFALSFFTIALAIATIFFLLATLGTMRDVVQLRAEVDALSYLVKTPPAPSFVGNVAPEPLARLVASEDRPEASDKMVVAFVTPACGPCESLTDGLGAAISEGLIRAENILFAIWALPGSDWETFVTRLPARYIADIDGKLARACEVRATPATLVISRPDLTVVDYAAEGDVRWITDHFKTTILPV